MMLLLKGISSSLKLATPVIANFSLIVRNWRDSYNFSSQNASGVAGRLPSLIV